MKKLGFISVVSFAISFLGYAAWFFNEDLFSKSIIIFIGLFLPIIGLITAFFSKKNSLKIAGILRNSLVLLWAVILPFISTLFWNQP